jgi:HEAT repeat protein
MQPAEIIAALEAPSDDRRAVMWALREDEPADALAAALASAGEPDTRQLLADMLGFQAAPEGVPALISALGDAQSGVRSSAADALGKVFLSHPDAPGRDAAGAALLERWQVEESTPVKHMLAAAMGATRHEPALGVLREAADDADRGLSESARWALTQF